MAKKYIKFLVFFLLFWTPFFCYAGPTTTSGDTAADVITRVRYALKETTEGYWLDAELVYYIDEAVTETVNRTRCLESGASNIIVIENTRSYSIPDTISGVSFGGVAKVEYDIGLSGNTVDQTQIYDLDRVPWKNLRYKREREIGNPKVFSVWANTLYIWPIPRDNVESGVTMSGNTIYLYNMGSPSGVTATTSAIETPAGLDPAISDYVKYMALIKQDSHKKAATYFALWEARCDRYRQDIMRRELPGETQ